MKNSDFYDYLQIIVLIFLVSYLIYPLFAIGFLIIFIIINVSISLTCKYQTNQLLQQIQNKNQEYFKTNQQNLSDNSNQPEQIKKPTQLTNKPTSLDFVQNKPRTTPLNISESKTTPLNISEQNEPFNLMSIINNLNPVEPPNIYERNNKTDLSKNELSRKNAMDSWMRAQIDQRQIYPSQDRLSKLSVRPDLNFMGY